MFYPPRKAAFVLVSTDHGTMIVNRFDWEMSEKKDSVSGVSADLLTFASYDAPQIGLLCKLLDMRRETAGDGAVVIDGGANIGTYTLALAKHMTGWGAVIAFEPFKWNYFPLVGNVCICNHLNVEPLQMALGKRNGVAGIKRFDPTKATNYGGISLRDTTGPLDEVQICTVDSFNLGRLDLLKLDIEGMELDALEGAAQTVKRCKPVICVEHIFCGLEALETAFKRIDYEMHPTGMNSVAFHKDDPVRQRITWFDSTKEDKAA